MPRLLELAYQLRYHRIGEWSLARWLIIAAWGLGMILFVQWILAERPAHPSLALTLALLLLAGLAVLGLVNWAAQRSYLVFDPESEVAPPAGKALLPEDKILHRAAGQFEVEGKAQFFAGLRAYWRTYTSREHAVLAIVNDTSILKVARVRETDLGMWYIFIRPDAILELAAGRVGFGATFSPALRITYRYTAPAHEGKRPPRPMPQAVYLWFEDDETRRRVWADLLADAPLQTA